MFPSQIPTLNFFRRNLLGEVCRFFVNSPFPLHELFKTSSALLLSLSRVAKQEAPLGCKMNVEILPSDGLTCKWEEIRFFGLRHRDVLGSTAVCGEALEKQRALPAPHRRCPCSLIFPVTRCSASPDRLRFLPCGTDKSNDDFVQKRGS